MKIYETRDSVLIAALNQHVQDVHVELFPEYFKPFNFTEVSEFFAKIIENPAFTFLVLEEDNISQGYVWLEHKKFAENAFKKAYETLYVHQISINEASRSKGFGSILLEHIYEFARQKNIGTVELDYWCDNGGAKKFYERQGFIKYREVVYRNVF
ncbi:MULTISPECIES: GNAT family N-acetyltransferase [unclassified Bacillus (in: firmicutes)]|uniref:GNAT family N-acetyltransferase n=1 Tax=unclassified Bacillus (in: firmicutes) TaxID=185979 RepID=UPI0008DEF838|nr:MULTISPECIES: GNAT family N-acetyltransferase [unclassified Bacillus (in: firmicutes)]SFA88313.1 Acetyltransferase (GNAT) domain-containing protein [Bacillus sp. UNCCL13]SFQ84574.1 Acetyltransferase (GNAT) domain-containing protein [Bacillus sp. cl95]